MSETSISSSPSKFNYTIYTTRMKRRSRRSKIDLSQQFNTDQNTNLDFFQNLLTSFYNDSGSEPAKPVTLENKSKPLLENPAVLSNFKPFELEKSLVMADHIFVQQLSQNKANLFPETQGFVTCTNLSQATYKSPCFATKCGKSSETDSFIITESELISCCNQAEQVLENSEQDCTKHTLTPKKTDDMMLVNSILEDFSQSPLRREQIITNSCCQHTPEFRFRRLPAKNYSRKHLNRTRIKLTHRYEETDRRLSSEYGEDTSFCSSLSIQEDDTFCENPNNQSVATTLNNSERLCENLLNLTEYFTQNELMPSFEGDQQSGDDLYISEESNDIVPNLRNVSDLLDNILILRSKYSSDLRDDSYDSSDNFNGFAKDEHTIVEENVVIASSNLVPKYNLCDNLLPNNLKEKEDNTFLDDWNEDNCHDIFACINTEYVLQQNNIQRTNNEGSSIAQDDLTLKCIGKHQTFIVPNVPTLNSPVSNCISSNNDSSKSIQLSNEANMLLPNIVDFTETEKYQLPNCDNEDLIKDVNKFENPEDYEWNDDCDLFLNFQTPVSFKENLVTNTQQKLPIIPGISQHKQDAPSTSKFASIGFTTAAGRNVQVTNKGQAIVQKLLNELAGEVNNSGNYEKELKDFKFKVYAKAHNLKSKTETPAMNVKLNEDQTLEMAQCAQLSIPTEQTSKDFKGEKGFEATIIDSKRLAPEIKISNRLNINISNAIHSADSSKLSQQTQESLGLRSKSRTISTNTQNSIQKLFEDSVENFLNDNESIENAFNAKVDQRNNVDTINMGFQTANGKQVSISRKAKQIVENLLKDFNADLDIEKDLNAFKTKLQTKNKDLKSELSQYSNNKADTNVQRNQLKEFHTASAKGKQTDESLLKSLNANLDVKICEKDWKANVINNNKVITFKSPSLDENIFRRNLNLNNELNRKSDQLDEDSAKCSQMLNANMDVGFQTANGKQVYVSEKAKQAVAILFTDINTTVNGEANEKYLKDMKTNEESSTNLQLDDEMPFKLINHKRKISADNNDMETPNKTPAAKIFKNDSQSSKSLLVEQSLKSPLTSAARSIITKTNLLSLTKKRKNKGNKPTGEMSAISKDFSNDLNACSSTPARTNVSNKYKEPVPETPNLKEFLSNASSTSTPRINKSQTFEDPGLKPINWKNEQLLDSSCCNTSQNNSLYATKLSESSASNISFNSPKPSCKERMDRLEMYGKAPDVSPMFIKRSHNCRPSGLRRKRSTHKPPES